MGGDFWIFTLQIPMWRYARAMNIPVIDITAKSGIKAFAPHWDDLNAYRRGEMDNHEYSQRYYEKVIPTLRTNPQEWEILTKNRTYALACYCRPGNFCHRHLFAMLSVTYLQSLGHSVEFQGELVPHPNNLHFFSRAANE
mgnify:CR=1 FL=1